MKILIIGGTGLIRTPMTRFFVERGDAVTHFLNPYLKTVDSVSES
jgi:hypothetical protein